MKASKVLILCSMLFLASLGACTANGQSDKQAVPVAPVSMTDVAAISVASWAETHHDFGKVPMGDKVRHRFEFTNIGTEPLTLESVKASCGCTTTDYTKGAIAPGATGFVETEMEAKAVGVFKKTVTVTANTEPKNVILSFGGEVMQ